MATTATADPGLNKEYRSENSGTGAIDHAPVNGNNNAVPRYDYGGNPLAHMNTGESARFPAFGGEFQPGLYRPTTERKFANPAPLGLSAFALTTFVLSLVNVNARGIAEPNIVVALAYGYGGLIQLLAGMWEMAVGNTFGATALSSYGGFWLSFAIVLTPGGFDIQAAYSTAAGAGANDFNYAFGFFLFGWFIFTFILLICTLRSTVAFFLLFFFLDLAFLLLALAHIYSTDGVANNTINQAGGYFGLFAAFMAWYNALAGIADDSNSFFVIPVAHFPWSVKGRERKAEKTERAQV
jgi:hypothetical protein